jgi:D-serine deaminase-like pyridoxal phosphate-dependent protein
VSTASSSNYFYPHTKSHNIPELAKRQLASGATGITVAKLGEAEVMFAAGITDILIAYPIVGEEESQRLAKLAQRATITVSLDSEEAARAISAAASRLGTRVGILCEVDVGFARCGLSNEADLLALAQKILPLPALESKGLMFFPGHFGVGPPQRAELRVHVNELLDRCFETFARADVPLEIVSGGSTPTAYESSLFHGVNEVRPGTYIFNDRKSAAIAAASLDDCALSVLVTVVSTAVPGKAIIDGGSKTFSSDRFQGEDGDGFGRKRSVLPRQSSPSLTI